MDPSEFSKSVHAAAEMIRLYTRVTPVEYSHFLSEITEAEVYIKLESEQVTGSLKARSMAYKILRTLDQDRESIKHKGVIVASSGNSALAGLYMMGKVDVSCTFYVPSCIPSAKECKLRKGGATVIKCEGDVLDAELTAKQTAESEGTVYISPYNDIDSMVGQGTVGLELLQQLPQLDVVYVAVGGGAVIGGIATYLKYHKPSVQVVGCQPLASKVMYESVKVGKIVMEEALPTLSDATAGGVEQQALTLPVCASCVDEWVLVTEEEITYALYLTLRDQHKLVEGSAAMAIACVIKHGHKYAGKTIAVVSCGANISMDSVKMVLDKYHEMEFNIET